MIELKNVNKTYKSKKSINTKALDNVSLNFDDKGMTFILGKSGSGKSTLLNVIGGLDKYDSGDMIILGKSSKDFNQADFDSYRNTYIGFVFQEFNILEDYDVYENIVLALQLQQKDVDKQQVENLLKKLELKELSHRKVNELSGGQKQRVAIARALIKEPKIILADEPTGNLDSSTGKQVMDLLKEISKEKLVIIVSHDRESANTYGDRIIEIKDGSIINDVKKKEFDYKIENNYKTIKSKLPFKESFKLGIGSLRHKKIKLCFTIILTVFSLLFLSIIDTLSSYNVNLAHSKLLKDRKEEFVQIEKYQWYSKDDYVNKYNLVLKETDITDIKNRIEKKSNLIYRVRNDYGYENIYDVLHISSEFDGYSYTYGNLELEIVEDSSFEYVKKFNVVGKIPEANNEIIISNVVADLIIEKGITPFNEDKLYYPKDYQELISGNKTYYFGENGQVQIVGIINYDLSKYKQAIEKERNAENGKINWTAEERKLFMEYSAKLNNIYNKIFVSEGFVEELGVENNLPLNSDYHYQLTSEDIKLWQEGMYFSPSLIKNEIEYYDGDKWISTNDLNKNEIILNIKQLEGFDLRDYRDKVTKYINQNLGKEQLELEKEFFAEYIKEFDIVNNTVTLKAIENGNISKSETFSNIKIVGVVGLITNSHDYYYVSSELMSKYDVQLLPVTGVLVLENGQNEYKKLMDEFPYNEKISLKSTYSYDVNDMVRTVDILKQIAFYVAVVLVIFTVILIGNFMFSSISYRKREIGILRGLGARSTDVIKIFLWEGIVLATISFVLASIGLFIATNLLNNIIMSGTDLLLTPFIITLRQFVVMLVIVYLIIFISSIIPIRRIAKMKPIDAILKK